MSFAADKVAFEDSRDATDLADLHSSCCRRPDIPAGCELALEILIREDSEGPSRSAMSGVMASAKSANAGKQMQTLEEIWRL